MKHLCIQTQTHAACTVHTACALTVTLPLIMSSVVVEEAEGGGFTQLFKTFVVFWMWIRCLD